MKEKIKILVVDDELIIREMLKEHLTDEGFNVVAVPSGEDALEIFKDDHDHMVITDIRMGGMSGIQLLGEVRMLDPEAVVIIAIAMATAMTITMVARCLMSFPLFRDLVPFIYSVFSLMGTGPRLRLGCYSSTHSPTQMAALPRWLPARSSRSSAPSVWKARTSRAPN